jgi:hypothetical protein
MGILGPWCHTHKTEDITECAAITRLLECGFGVLTPLGQMQRYDLVIEGAGEKFLRVQCKTGRINEDKSKIMFSSASTMNDTVKHKGYRGYKGQCEYFAVNVISVD